MKDPAFLFYPGDWHLGTMHMTLLEKGAYIELLMLQFARGKFNLSHAKHVLSGNFDVVWPCVSEKFNTDGQFYWNERLEFEKNKRKTHADKQQKRALDGWKKKKEGCHGNATAMPLENENENIIVNKDNSIIDEKTFLEYCEQVLGEKYPAMEFSLRAKYEQWKEDGWRDGYGKKIKNWKTKIKNTITYLKPTENGTHSRADKFRQKSEKLTREIFGDTRNDS